MIFIKIINTIDGHEIFVDDEDYDYLMLLYDFKLNVHGYPVGKPKPQYKKMGLFSSVPIHKILIDKGVKGRHVVIDHKDGNKLNNQKENLRICTHADNMKNRKPQGGTSQYKGVHWGKTIQNWRVRININGKKKVIGTFSNEIAAANAYNYYAKMYYGEFALLNNCPYMDKDEWMIYKCEKKKTSKYHGISFVGGKWLAQIWDGKRNVRIGNFETEEEAALAYNKKAIEIFGERAKLNKTQYKFHLIGNKI